MDLFRIEGFVEDKNLPKVKRLLVGLVLEFKDAPVVNATAKDGKLVQATEGRSVDLFVDWLQKTKKKEITAKEVGDFLLSIGRARSSSNSVINDCGSLLRVKKGARGVYLVVQKEIQK